MTFRVFASSIDKPENYAEVPRVSLHLDREALSALREIVEKYDDNFESFLELGHTHLSLYLHPGDYNRQQADLISKDVLFYPMLTQELDEP